MFVLTSVCEPEHIPLSLAEKVLDKNNKETLHILKKCMLFNIDSESMGTRQNSLITQFLRNFTKQYIINNKFQLFLYTNVFNKL